MCATGRVLADPVLSPDGGTVAFVAALDGSAAVMCVPAAGGPEVVLSAVRPVRPHPMGGGVLAWGSAGDGLVVVGADGGLWWQPWPGGPAQVLLAAERGGALGEPAVSPDGTRVAVSRDQREILVVHRSSAEVVVLSADHDFALDPTWLDERTVAWHAWSVPNMAWDHSMVVAAPSDGSGPVRPVVDHGAQVTQPRARAGRLAHLDDHGGWLNVAVDGTVLVAEPFEHGPPTWGGGVRTLCWSPDGRHLAFTRNEEGFGRLCTVELATGEVRDIAKAVHVGLSWQGTRLAAVRTGGVTPHAVVSYDMSEWGRERTVLARGPVAGLERALVEPEVVTVSAADGTALHGRLYRVGEGPHPLVCWIHGGPTDQWQVTCIARIGFLVQRGYAVLVPDHRGSTGHGRAYAQALRGRWGELDVSDVAGALVAARQRGWSDGSAAVMGGSAGGFTALNVATDHPDLVRAAVALYPVTNLEALAATTHRFEAHSIDGLAGPDRTHWVQRSPISRAGQVRVPLLLLHGRDDKVVAVEDTSAYAASLVAGGADVSLTIFDGEGHGWKRPDTVRAELDAIDSFLTRHLRSGSPLP